MPLVFFFLGGAHAYDNVKVIITSDYGPPKGMLYSVPGPYNYVEYSTRVSRSLMPFLDDMTL
jgi:hypothetical protein